MNEQHVVVCEGYHDRAFWQGWLLHLGCADPGDLGKGQRAEVQDPAGDKVRGGQFAFTSGGRFIRVVPAGGVGNLWRTAEFQLRNKKLFTRRLVVNLDDDQTANEVVAERQPPPAVAGMAATAGTSIVSMIWSAPDPPGTLGVPEQQTLERLVCAAVAAAYPARAEAVQRWIDSRPEPAGPRHKASSWSYMAGWHAKQGCEAFLRLLWENARVRSELRSRLEAINAWSIAQSLIT